MHALIHPLSVMVKASMATCMLCVYMHIKNTHTHACTHPPPTHCLVNGSHDSQR